MQLKGHFLALRVLLLVGDSSCVAVEPLVLGKCHQLPGVGIAARGAPVELRWEFAELMRTPTQPPVHVVYLVARLNGASRNALPHNPVQISPARGPSAELRIAAVVDPTAPKSRHGKGARHILRESK